MPLPQLLISILLSIDGYADFVEHLKRVKGPEVKEQQVKNIDCLFIINLDHQKERFEKCLAQFTPYKISPLRFPAVNGWELSPDVLKEVGVKYGPGMLADEWVHWNPPGKPGLLELDFLREDLYGRTVFFNWMSLGGIGCSLSHLSLLQNAYDTGYETIWAMEDDITVQSDPHLLSALVSKLDELAGKDGWDILYTDTDLETKNIYPEDENLETDLKSDLWFYWRPDVGLKDQKPLAKRTVISADFVQIGSRICTHSMIIRRSGMKKILDFIKAHHIYLPYDHELAVVPGLKMFNLRYDIVTATHKQSDTDYLANKNKQLNQWSECKKGVVDELATVHGWRDPGKAMKVMEFIYEHRPSLCVEIGSFGGYITYPIAKTLQFLERGMLYAIDAWDIQAAIEGINKSNRIEWWQKVNMEAMHDHFNGILAKHQLEKYCQPLQLHSKQAADKFADQSVDFLFLDGNESQEGSLKDVLLYYPKVKPEGFIWLNNAYTKKQAISFLMKNAEWIKDSSFGIDCLIFKKPFNAAPSTSVDK